ncbi:MAG: hypothetical protein J5J00_05000 [Deltaproteobacteria bacterium]|nr:hypothetical protein [Deltaproteobacteria bacterium]
MFRSISKFFSGNSQAPSDRCAAPEMGDLAASTLTQILTESLPTTIGPGSTFELPRLVELGINYGGPVQFTFLKDGERSATVYELRSEADLRSMHEAVTAETRGGSVRRLPDFARGSRYFLLNRDSFLAYYGELNSEAMPPGIIALSDSSNRAILGDVSRHAVRAGLNSPPGMALQITMKAGEDRFTVIRDAGDYWCNVECLRSADRADYSWQEQKTESLELGQRHQNGRYNTVDLEILPLLPHTYSLPEFGHFTLVSPHLDESVTFHICSRSKLMSIGFAGDIGNEGEHLLCLLLAAPSKGISEPIVFGALRPERPIMIGRDSSFLGEAAAHLPSFVSRAHVLLNPHPGTLEIIRLPNTSPVQVCF